MSTPSEPASPDLNELASRAVQVHQRLLAYYGMPEWRDPLPALDELVSTILSQNTNDRNRDAAYRSLRERFPDWESVRDAPEPEIIDAIRTAGLANQKGARIKQVLLAITAERGTLDLEFLKDLSASEAWEWLVRFKGVGPKTAAIVLQFSLDKPAFPVDTHIFRVCGRIGLRPPKMDAEQSHTHLGRLFLPESYGPAHLNLIRLGREICGARKPDCQVCPIQDLCDYSRNLQPAC
jgi:endonuclease-3